MKILVLGKTGQVGQALTQTLTSLGEVVALGRAEANLEDLSGLSQQLNTVSPDIIVNAAAYTAVDTAESEIERAELINHQAVKVIADYAQCQGSLFVHYSTDYVFDGRQSHPYIETDVTNPLSVYGQSKRAGEEAILRSNSHYLILRTSWVFSSHGHNFIKTVLRLARDLEKLNMIQDQHGAPTSADFIAEITALAISAYINQTLSKGIYHLTATGKTTWYHLAVHVLQRARAHGIHLKLTPEQIHAIPTEAYPLPAVRPKNSCLNTDKLSRGLNYSFPKWESHVNKVVDQLTQLEFSV